MTKREKELYKNIEKNQNNFISKFYNFFDNKLIFIIFCIIVLFTLFLSFLDLFNVLSWKEFSNTINIVDGVEKQDSKFCIYCLDVGQSDCTIIVCDNEIMMIDTGTVNQVYNIRTSLYTLGIDKIDYMVITHQHDDHMAGAAEIIEHYDVSNILIPHLSNNNSVESETYKNLSKIVAENDINTIPISADYSFKIGSSTVDVLSPITQDDNLNNMSAVLKVTYENTIFLFQGDAESKIEKQLLRSDKDLSADVIKVGHHGSDTSSYGAFLDSVNPKYAIISCNSDNYYGHPNSFVVDRLEERDIKPYITSLHGDITIISDGNKVSVISSK